MAPATEKIVGRAAEIAALRAFLSRPAPAALVIEGEAGCGKTTVWEAGLDGGGGRVLVARAIEGESALSLSGVGDLLAGVDLERLDGLPGPQRRALRAALLLDEPDEEAPQDPRALAVAFLTALRELAREGPVLVAVDDVQWLDPASAAILAFAARRLRTEVVRLLVTLRVGAGSSSPVLDAIPAAERLAIGPLGEDDVAAVLASRLRFPLAPRLVEAIHARSAGNPFYALELARALERVPRPAAGEDLPLPPSLHGLVRDRLAALPAAAAEAALAVALLGDARLGVLSRVADPAAIEDALAADVLCVDDDRVRFTHPLLAAGARAEATVPARRRMHERLAAAVDDPEGRARHLARAAGGPDEAVAALLDAAATAAEARGDLYACAELSELAVRLTRPDGDARVARLVRAGWAMVRTARVGPANALARDALAAARPGGEQADALHLLAFTAGDYEASLGLLGRAVEQATDAERLVAIRDERINVLLATGRVEAALEEARAVATLAERLGDPSRLAIALAHVGFLARARGEPAWEVLDRAVAVAPDPTAGIADRSPAMVRALCLTYGDRLDEARGTLEAIRDAAHDRGDEDALVSVLVHLGYLECRADRYAVAATHARALLALTDPDGDPQLLSVGYFVLGWAEAFMGAVDDARTHAAEAARLSHAAHDQLFWPHAEGVLGFIALSLGDLATADRHLRPIWPALTKMGFREPTVWPVLPNAIEALVGLGEMDAATALLGDLTDLGRALDSAWALALAARCHGLLLAARGAPEEALSSFGDALEEHRRLPGEFERARTLLAQGRTLRRLKRRREARAALASALAVFEALGTPLWAEQAREALARIGGRAPARDALTPTEERVAALVAEGRSNREAAAELFVSVRTIEANLTRVYAKLGVRSRAELVRMQAAGEPAARPPRPG